MLKNYEHFGNTLGSMDYVNFLNAMEQGLQFSILKNRGFGI